MDGATAPRPRCALSARKPAWRPVAPDFHSVFRTTEPWAAPVNGSSVSNGTSVSELSGARADEGETYATAGPGPHHPIARAVRHGCVSSS